MVAGRHADRVHPNGPHWSSEASIWIMSADGSHQRRLWSHSAEGGALSWSPSGKALAFTYDSEIYTIQADGEGLRRSHPGWGQSRSGLATAFVSGAYRDRTGDLRLAKPALSQLS